MGKEEIRGTDEDSPCLNSSYFIPCSSSSSSSISTARRESGQTRCHPHTPRPQLTKRSRLDATAQGQAYEARSMKRSTRPKTPETYSEEPNVSDTSRAKSCLSSFAFYQDSGDGVLSSRPGSERH